MNPDAIIMAAEQMEAALDIYDELAISPLKTEAELMNTAAKMRFAQQQMLKITFYVKKALEGD